MNFVFNQTHVQTDREDDHERIANSEENSV
jgi:hypothetical protein